MEKIFIAEKFLEKKSSFLIFHRTCLKRNERKRKSRENFRKNIYKNHPFEPIKHRLIRLIRLKNIKR